MVTAMTSHTVPDCRAILGTHENTTFAAIPSRGIVDPACSSERLINSLPVNSSVSSEFDERLYVQQYECLFHKDMPYMHSQQPTLYSIKRVEGKPTQLKILTRKVMPTTSLT
ncbi:hypothetical protein Pelo_8443 [Pelomyxa schiedti]|nr:hypothetical protein Pelo_8443 [Pelomyxa schiedti]